MDAGRDRSRGVEEGVYSNLREFVAEEDSVSTTPCRVTPPLWESKKEVARRKKDDEGEASARAAASLIVVVLSRIASSLGLGHGVWPNVSIMIIMGQLDARVCDVCVACL